MSKDKLAQYSQYQRVGVFVDVQNMFYSAKRVKNGKLDFGKLMERAVRGRQLIRAICYCVDNKDIDQSGFTDMLRNNGYEIKAKELRVRADGSSKADWDMGIAIDAVCMADKLDIIVLVSGDGDFIDLVEFLKHRGVFVEAMSFEGSTNEDLIKSVDLYTPIERDLLLSQRRNHSKPRPKKGSEKEISSDSKGEKNGKKTQKSDAKNDKQKADSITLNEPKLDFGLF